jgi:hypothetical protein
MKPKVIAESSKGEIVSRFRQMSETPNARPNESGDRKMGVDVVDSIDAA